LSDVPLVRLIEGVVNETFISDQIYPAISTDLNSGNYIIVWRNESTARINYRIYNKLGKYLTGIREIQTSTVNGSGMWPSVDELSNGDYFIVWPENSGIYGRYLESDGGILGTEDFLISGQGEKYATPEIAIVPGVQSYGDIYDVAMIAWLEIIDGIDDDNVFGRRLRLYYDIAPDPANFLEEPFHMDDSEITQGVDRIDGEAEIDGTKIVEGALSYFASSWIYYLPREEPNEDPRHALSYNIYDMVGEILFDPPPEFDVQPAIPNLHISPAVAIDRNNNITIAWADYKNQVPTIRAQQFDLNGNVIIEQFQVNVREGVTPTRGKSSVDIKSFENNDFIIVWEAIDGTNGDNVIIFGRRYDQYGNPIDSEEFIISDIHSNAYKPGVDTHRDKFIMTWQDDREIEGKENTFNIYSSIWTCDVHDPVLEEVPQIESNAFLYTDVEQLGGVPIGPAISYDSNESRIPSGIDSVVIYSTSYAFDGCVFDDTTLMENVPGTDEYNGLLRKQKGSDQLIVAGTMIEYHVRSYDGTGKIVEKPEEHEPDYEVWVTNRGDVNVDGRITVTDVDLACDCYLNNPNIEDYMCFFANWDGIGDVTMQDVLAIQENIGTQWFNEARLCQTTRIAAVPDKIGIDIGSGEPGSSSNVVAVYLENDSTVVRGTVFEIEYDENVFTLADRATTPRTEGYIITPPCPVDDGKYIVVKSFETIYRRNIRMHRYCTYISTYLPMLPRAVIT
jgi:hypothetical protein